LASTPTDGAHTDSRGSFEQFLEFAPDAIVGVDRDGRITVANAQVEALFGYTGSELVGERVELLVPDRFRNVHPAHREAYLADPRTRPMGAALELFGRRKDGTEFPAEISLSSMETETGLLAMAAIRDMTEQRSTDRARMYLAAIVDSSDDAIFGKALDGTIVSWNKGAERLYGYPAAEVIGRPVSVLVPPERKHETEAILKEVGEARSVEHRETVRLHKDGRRLMMSLTVSPIRDGAGRVVGAATIARDVSAEKAAASKFEQFVEFAPDAIVGVGPEGRIVLVNAQTELLFGYDRDELVGLNVDVLVPERFRAMHPGHRDGYFADRRARPMGAELELFGRRRDGTEFPAEISLSSIETEDGPLATAAIRDVSDREHARRTLKQFLEFAPDAIVGVGRDGLIVLVNAQTEALFGYDRDELLGLAVEVLVPERFRSVHPTHRQGYFGDPRMREMGAELELSGRRKDGTEFPAEISLSSIETEAGPLATAAIRDVTDRVVADREKDALRTELEESRRLDAKREKDALEAQLNQLRRLESVGQLAGGIAHDFNNILGVILNYAQFVAEEIEEGSPALKDVEEIRRAAERAAALTRQLLIFSRREVIRPEVLDLNGVVSDLDRLLRRALGEHVQLETRFAPDLSAVEADPGQVEQVLVNLAVNARDAMPGGGRLQIETGNVELDEDTLPDLPAGRYVRLSVSDTGMGMAPEVAARAFEPFFSTKPRGEGTGLGLTTVYGIVSEAGGNISIYSEPGVGTTVKVYMPASDVAAAPAESKKPKPVLAQGHGETVLLVEDEDGMRRLTERILVKAGYVVLAAHRGASALDTCRREDQQIDLLLTDVVMPEMLGPELVEQAIAIRPGLRVLYMSGYVHQVAAQLASPSPEEGTFVEKPFTATTLLGRVREALDAPA
jgi:PAS domain S-box-containing protein